MEESYETFEEELGPPRADPPPQKPVRQTRRPEMYATRKVREEIPQQPRAEPKTLPREPSYPRTIPSAPLQKGLTVQNMTPMETPWENVTLNRCLFVAITILVLTSGFQRLHETLRGQGTAEEEEEVGLIVRRSSTLRHRGQPVEPETSLWDVMFWWLPDLDDEDDEEDDEEDDNGEVKRGKSKKGATAQTSRLRNKPLTDKKLMKQREGKLKDRRAKKARHEEIKVKKERDKKEEPEEAADDEDEGNEETEPEKNKKPEEKKEKKKTQKG